MTACQLVWEAPWQKRLISQLWARASRDAPSRGNSRAMTYPFAWSRRQTILRWAHRRPTAAWCTPATIRRRARLRRRSTLVVASCTVRGRRSWAFCSAAPGRWCWGLTTRTVRTWSSFAATALPTACPSCQSSDPTASASWSRARVPMQRARYGAPRLGLSTRLRLPSPRWRTPWPTG